MEPELFQCGTCGQQYQTHDEELAHICPVTGFAPTDPRHYGPDFVEIQIAALQRGLATAEKEGDVEAAVATQAEIDNVKSQQV